jgi:hypothetical protein
MILVVTAEFTGVLDKAGTEFGAINLGIHLDSTQPIAATQTQVLDLSRSYLSKYRFTTTAVGSIAINKDSAPVLNVAAVTTGDIQRETFRVHYFFLPTR